MTLYNIIVDLKYIKKGENDGKKMIEEKRVEGIEQLKRYNLDKENLKKYLLIFVGRDVKSIESLD